MDKRFYFNCRINIDSLQHPLFIYTEQNNSGTMPHYVILDSMPAFCLLKITDV